MYYHAATELHLVKVEERDLELLQALKSESWPTTHRTTICNEDDQKRWFASLDTDVHFPSNLVLIARAPNGQDDGPGIKVGCFKISNVDWVSRKADVAWDVFAHQRKKGFGKKLVQAGRDFCLDCLNLRRLDAEVLETNEASKKCAVAAGFVLEGLKRKAVYKQGKYLDSLVYGFLLDE